MGMMCCTPLLHAALESLPRLAHCDRVRVHLGSHKVGSECVCVRPLQAHWLVPAAEHDLLQGEKWPRKDLLQEKRGTPWENIYADLP